MAQRGSRYNAIENYIGRQFDIRAPKTLAISIDHSEWQMFPNVTDSSNRQWKAISDALRAVSVRRVFDIGRGTITLTRTILPWLSYDIRRVALRLIARDMKYLNVPLLEAPTDALKGARCVR